MTLNIVYASIIPTDEETLLIQWGIEKCGFGEFYFKQENGYIYCDNEAMRKETVFAVVRKAFENLIIANEDEDGLMLGNINIKKDIDDKQDTLLNKTNRAEIEVFIKKLEEESLTLEELQEQLKKAVEDIDKVVENAIVKSDTDSLEAVNNMVEEIKRLRPYPKMDKERTALDNLLLFREDYFS